MAGENSWEEIINGRCWDVPLLWPVGLSFASFEPWSKGPKRTSYYFCKNHNRFLKSSDWFVANWLEVLIRIWSVLAGLSGQNFCGIIPIKQGDEEPQSQASGWNCAIFHQPEIDYWVLRSSSLRIYHIFTYCRYIQMHIYICVCVYIYIE